MAVDIYVSDYRFNAIAKAVAELEPCEFAGRITADQVKMVLGEIGDIWPLSIAADVIAANADHPPVSEYVAQTALTNESCSAKRR